VSISNMVSTDHIDPTRFTTVWHLQGYQLTKKKNEAPTNTSILGMHIQGQILPASEATIPLPRRVATKSLKIVKPAKQWSRKVNS
ncbi:unnamed protein product, partial [Callosobruchus maculatus]